MSKRLSLLLNFNIGLVESIAMNKEIHLDIGCGRADYFCKQAVQNPDNVYLAMDPNVWIDSDLFYPSNLYLLAARAYMDGDLPFKPESIDVAHISFVMDKLVGLEEELELKRLRRRGSEDGYIGNLYGDEELLSRYSLMLKQLKRVLKDGAKITVCEPKYNIYILCKLYLEEGFDLISLPTQVEDKEKTAHVKNFFEWIEFEKSQWREKEGIEKRTEDFKDLPMEFECRWMLLGI